MPMPEMTYEQWCADSKALLKECETYNKWARRTMHRVLTDLAPRIGALKGKMYNGCGFHYALEGQLGKLIGFLAEPHQWSASHCGKIPNDRINMITTQVVAEGLFKDVAEAEASAAEWLKKNQISA